MLALHDNKTHDQISLIRVNNERDLRRYNVDQLAHRIHQSPVERRFPIFLVYYHGRIRAYFQVTERVVIRPAFDPELLEPRDFVRLVRDLAIETKRQYGDPLFLLCGIAEELGEEHMKTLRLKKSEETVYIYDDEGEDK